MVWCQDRQRVYLAAQLFSERVAKALQPIIGDRYRKEAEFIALVDQALDTVNSSHVLDGKLHRSAFGLAQAFDQYARVMKFTGDARRASRRQPVPAALPGGFRDVVHGAVGPAQLRPATSRPRVPANIPPQPGLRGELLLGKETNSY